MTDEVEGGNELQRRAAAKFQAMARQVVDEGVGPLQGSVVYAEDRLRRARRAGRSEEQARRAAIRRIVRESVTSAGTTGFVTGLGGLITMPITVPASVAGNFIINARLVGAIAHLRGYDLSDPQVQMMIQFVIAGVGIEQAATELGVKLGEQAIGRVAARAAWAAIEAIPAILIDKMGVRVGYLLVIRYGTSRTAAVLTKMVPLLGSVIGGTVDASFTRATAALARKAFPDDVPGISVRAVVVE
jgi:hypothetical protein